MQPLTARSFVAGGLLLPSLPWWSVVVGFLFCVACSSPESQPQASFVPVVIPLGDAKLDGPGHAAVGGPAQELGLEIPQHRSEDFLEQQTKVGLQLLRARSLEENLATFAKVRIPQGPHTIGTEVPIHFELRNGLGQDLSLLAPETGLMVELEWQIERWFAYGERDQFIRRAVARIDGGFELKPDEEFQERSQLPLVTEGEGSVFWRVSVQARLRSDGAVFGEEELPVRSVRLQRAEFQAFPSGWRDLAVQPLQRLEQALEIESHLADPHIIISAALLTPSQQAAGLKMLVQDLEQQTNHLRAEAVMTALAAMTGVELARTPTLWIDWWNQRQS